MIFPLLQFFASKFLLLALHLEAGSFPRPDVYKRQVLPFLRRQGKGHIVNISSVAAVAHIPFQTFYSASEAAVSSYSYALANEVKPYGCLLYTSRCV